MPKKWNQILSNYLDVGPIISTIISKPITYYFLLMGAHNEQ